MTTSSLSVPGRRTPPILFLKGCWKASRIICLHLVPLNLHGGVLTTLHSQLLASTETQGAAPRCHQGQNPGVPVAGPHPCLHPAGAAPPVQLQDVGFGVQQAVTGKGAPGREGVCLHPAAVQ